MGRGMSLLSEQIKAEQEDGMYKPHEHCQQGHILTHVWWHPLDGVQPMPMDEYRAHKIMILKLLELTGRCQEVRMEK